MAEEPNIQDKSLFGSDILTRFSKWVNIAKQRLGSGESIVDHQPMRLLKFTPHGYEDLFKNEKQEQDINTCLHEDWSDSVRIKYNTLCFDQEFREVMIFEEGLRYYCSRRPSILAASDNLERFARDTKKEFNKP